MENSLAAYSSCSYAWDEPCHPHRLVLEVEYSSHNFCLALKDLLGKNTVWICLKIAFIFLHQA
jgi:hypothetical protein